MSETPEVKQDAVEPEVNPHEEQAREQGWVSKEEWTKDGKSADDWRPAKEFVERGELFKSIHQVKRELKTTQARHDALTKHHQYVFEKAYQKALTDLKAERRQAMKNEDLEKVAVVEEQMEELQAEHAKEKEVLVAQQQAAAAANNVNPEFQAWVDKNQWYATDNDMREFAEAVGLIYIQKNPGAAPSTVLQHVEAKVRKQYSEKFGVRKAAPNAVAGVDRTSRKTSGSEVILDEMETQIMKTLVSNGDMTEEQYKAEIKKARGL